MTLEEKYKKIIQCIKEIYNDKTERLAHQHNAHNLLKIQQTLKEIGEII